MAPSILQSVRGSKKSGTLDSIEETLEDQVEALKAELASLSKNLRERGRDQGRRTRRKAEAGVDDLIQSGEEILGELRDLYGRGEAQVRSTVRQHPLATIGAAAALALVVALLARR